MRAVEAHAAEWAAVFSHVPGHMLVDFLARLLRPPSGGPAVAAIFAPHALEALASRLVDPKQEETLRDCALAILLQYCRSAGDEVSSAHIQATSTRLVELGRKGHATEPSYVCVEPYPVDCAAQQSHIL